MTATELIEKRAETEWMDRLKDSFEPIERLLRTLPEGLKKHEQIVFERLFEAALQDARGALPRAPPAGVPALPRVAPGVENFRRFVSDYGFTMDALANVVDVESGQVLARNLATTKSESERRIAALLALTSAYKTGEFAVTRDQLIDACKLNGAWDSANFASNMAADFNGSVIFIRDPNGGYKVSRPGEAYIAEVVRSLLPKTNGGASP